MTDTDITDPQSSLTKIAQKPGSFSSLTNLRNFLNQALGAEDSGSESPQEVSGSNLTKKPIQIKFPESINEDAKNILGELYHALFQDATVVPQQRPASMAKGADSPPHQPKDNAFAGFMKEVGDALPQAQKGLDAKAVSDWKPGDPLPSSAYRIPRLSAEIAFNLEKDTDTGFNLLLWHTDKSNKETLNQKISFDVVAVPVPPEQNVQNVLRQNIAARLPVGDAWLGKLDGAHYSQIKDCVVALRLDNAAGVDVLLVPNGTSPISETAKFADGNAKKLLGSLT